MHDAFFKVLSKKKPMYACLVDGCEEKFTHDDKRNRHLVQVRSLSGFISAVYYCKSLEYLPLTVLAFQVHQYPVGFSFHRPRRVQRKSPSSKQSEKKKRPRKKKDRANITSRMDVDQAAAEPVVAQDTANKPTESEALEKTEWNVVRPDEQPTQDVDMLDALEDGMRNLRIPKTLSFGRKQRGHR